MSLVSIPGAGLWLPTLPWGAVTNSQVRTTADSALLDADEEEVQFIASVHIDGGGSKTFGTSGSKIDWLPGGSITFASGSTLRVGVKKASQIDTSNGPAFRATIGAAAFDVYDDLVGGTDTITSTTWRSDPMSAGTPYTVADGDLLAVCFHLDTTSGTPSVKIRCMNGGHSGAVLVTSGPTYTAQTLTPNLIITFDDGTLGWLEPSTIQLATDAASSTIGNGNINANVFRVPFACAIDAIHATMQPSTNAANFALELYSTPLATPGLVESIAHDANVTYSVGTNRSYTRRFATPRTLTINTDYAVGVKQTTATAVSVCEYNVNDANHFKPNGMGSECYAAISTAGATFAAQNSGKRRYLIYVRVSQLSDNVSSGGAIYHGAMAGGLLA